MDRRSPRCGYATHRRRRRRSAACHHPRGYDSRAGRTGRRGAHASRHRRRDGQRRDRHDSGDRRRPACRRSDRRGQTHTVAVDRQGDVGGRRHHQRWSGRRRRRRRRHPPRLEDPAAARRGGHVGDERRRDPTPVRGDRATPGPRRGGGFLRRCVLGRPEARPATRLGWRQRTWPATGVRSTAYSRDKATVEAMLASFEAARPGDPCRAPAHQPRVPTRGLAASEIHRLFLGRWLPWHLPRVLRA